ncbi:hypothetical protein BDV19DRAFT_387176 [Aspergillus venezuelensis]
MLAGAGHKEHGIDVSGEMVKIASRKITSGTFEKADMRTFTPPSGEKFDAVFAILSLFRITAGDTMGTYDSTWDCLRYLGKPWMDQYTNEVFFSEDAWHRMLRDAGFKVEAETFYDFVPEDAKHQTPERHHFLNARRNGDQNPLLGPYYLPKTDESYLEELYPNLSSKGKVLYLGSQETSSAMHSSKFELYDGSLDTVLFPPETFAITIVPWKLDSLTDSRKAVSEIS